LRFGTRLRIFFAKTDDVCFTVFGEAFYEIVQMNPSNKAQAFLTAIIATVPLCLAFLYLCGLTFNRFYFDAFGLDQRTLAFSLYDQAAKGFALSFSDILLRLFLLVLFVAIPVAVTYTTKWSWFEHSKAVAIPATILVITFWSYSESKTLGVKLSSRDHSKQSMLDTVDFSIGNDRYHGSLLYLKDDTLFVDRLIGDNESDPEPGVAIFKISDLKQIKIIGRMDGIENGSH
jgi:hypothetical protein